MGMEAHTTFNNPDLATIGSPGSGALSEITVPGGASSPFNTAAAVTSTVTNSCTISGAEVAQLYTGLSATAPSSPIRQLRGF
ncbi:hypothetical protein NA56DRAFT_646478, partial [Hyaloscypha hepaticicola]